MGHVKENIPLLPIKGLSTEPDIVRATSGLRAVENEALKLKRENQFLKHHIQESFADLVTLQQLGDGIRSHSCSKKRVKSQAAAHAQFSPCLWRGMRPANSNTPEVEKAPLPRAPVARTAAQSPYGCRAASSLFSSSKATISQLQAQLAAKDQELTALQRRSAKEEELRDRLSHARDNISAVCKSIEEAMYCSSEFGLLNQLLTALQRIDCELASPRSGLKAKPRPRRPNSPFSPFVKGQDASGFDDWPVNACATSRFEGGLSNFEL